VTAAAVPERSSKHHTAGGYWIWFVFFISYAPRAAMQSIWYLAQP
jgi:hypothetical protein